MGFYCTSSCEIPTLLYPEAWKKTLLGQNLPVWVITRNIPSPDCYMAHAYFTWNFFCLARLLSSKLQDSLLLSREEDFNWFSKKLTKGFLWLLCNVKVHMTWKIFSTYLKGLSKYRRMAFFFLKYLFSF